MVSLVSLVLGISSAAGCSSTNADSDSDAGSKSCEGSESFGEGQACATLGASCLGPATACAASTEPCSCVPYYWNCKADGKWHLEKGACTPPDASIADAASEGDADASGSSSDAATDGSSDAAADGD